MFAELSEILTADGISYDLTDGFSKFLLRTAGGMGIPSIEMLTMQNNGQGLLFKDYLLEPRELVANMRIQGCSRDEYWTLREEILNILRPNRGGEMTFIFTKPDLTSYGVKGLVTEFPFSEIPDGWDEWGFTEQMSILCNDPIWFSSDELSESSSYQGADELVFPITFGGAGIVFEDNSVFTNISVTYQGTWYTYPTFTLSGPFSYAIVSHAEKGVVVRVNASINVGETLEIDLENRTILRNDGTDLFKYLSSDSNLVDFRLEPTPIVAGGVNTIGIQLQDNNTANLATMTYRTRYIGI